MARRLRIDIPGYPQHLVVRGNNRDAIFADDSDRLVFLAIMQDSLAKAEASLHAFVLMSNHVHLLATGHREGELSRFMHDLGSRYARLVNQRWGRSGTLFEGRFRSSLVQDDAYLVTCMRYIDLNPVRAHIVRHPADYPWSSFRRNAALEPATPLVPGPAFLALGESTESRGQHYRELCESGLAPSTVEGIRDCLRKERALGDPVFIKMLESRLPVYASARPRGRPRQ